MDEHKARIEMLKLLYGKPCKKQYLLDAMNEIANKYDNEEFAIDIAESIDFEHMDLMNFQVHVDPQYHFNFAKRESNELLTKKGKQFLNIL